MFKERPVFLNGGTRAWALLGILTSLLGPSSYDQHPDPIERGKMEGFRLAETGDCTPIYPDIATDRLIKENRPLGYAFQFFRQRKKTCERAHSLIDVR